MIKVLSYGAGTQTFAMLCLIEAGLIEKPDLIIFADTQNEQLETYQHMGEIAIPIMHELDIKFVVVSHGNLYKDSILQKQTPKPPICTDKYKIREINKYLRKTYPGEIYEVWIGYTTDEEERFLKAESHQKYKVNRFPLLELNLSREQCIEFIIKCGYPVPPKSGCWFCPWQTTMKWLRMKRDNPIMFKAAVNLESNSGYKKLPFGTTPRLSALNLQMTMDFEDTDMKCSSGYCGV